MPYVQRDVAGKVVGLYANFQEGYAEEWLDEGHPDLPPTADDAKAIRWNAIKAERDRRRTNGGVKVGNYWFKSDDRAVGEYTALNAISVGLSGTAVLRAGWRTMEPSVTVDMTPNLVKQILAAGFAAVAAIDDAAQAHKTAMDACSDPATYDFSAGWPPAFGE
jgi:hypothetical protein